MPLPLYGSGGFLARISAAYWPKMCIRDSVKPRRQGEQGGIVKAEGAMYASKVMPICPKCGKAVRVGHVEKDGKMVRVCKK